jgi:hypothetical protein
VAEISGADLQAFTKGRLQASDAEVLRMLAAALAVARRYAGWHVSPVRLADGITVDGPDSRVLMLPTRKIVGGQPTSITEDGTLLASGTYKASVGDGPGLSRPIAVRKTGGGYWSAEYASIVIVMDHGYTEIEAADWRQAIMGMVDQMSLVAVTAGMGVSPLGLKTKEIDDVRYQWANSYSAMAEDVLFSFAHILDDYQLPAVEFL